MSTPTSTAPDEPPGIRAALEAEIARPPISGDPSMRLLRRAVIGTPLLVRSPDGVPAYWLVPLEIGRHACGFARADLAGRIAQVGIFGAGTDDLSGCPETAFFHHPPKSALDEIRAKHVGKPLGEPMFSYDGSPAKWGWRITMGTPVTGIALITPGGWYGRTFAGEQPPGKEG